VFRNILVAIDRSPAAMAALEKAIELARSEGARFVLLSVAVPPRWRYSGPTYVPYPSVEDLEREAWDVVRRAEALVPPDVSVCSVVRMGPPAAAILARAEEGEHDLVVMGSRGLGRLGSLFLGSVSRAVVARSPVPVLIVRARRDRAVQSAGGRPSREVHAGRSPAAVSMEAEPTTKRIPAVVLWLVAVLLLELRLTWWMFDRMYAP
jgi:nucleotide-binding universal stress UspA family protein